AAAGVLPELNHVDAPRIARQVQVPPPKHTPPRRLPEALEVGQADAPLPPPPSGAPAYAPRIDGHDARLAELKQLLQRLSATGQRRALTGSSSFDANASDTEADNDTSDTLEQHVLQHSLDQIWTYEGQPRDLKSALIEAARQFT